MKKHIIYLLIISSYLLAGCNLAANKNLPQEINQEVLTLFPLGNYDQRVTTWVNPNSSDYNTSLLTPDVQKKHSELFYEHNYGKLSPWDENFVGLIFNNVSPEDIISIQKGMADKYNNRGKKGNDLGYGENYRPYLPIWADQITNNMDIAQFTHLSYNQNNRVIAINNLYARTLPTKDVHFYSNKIAGQGYPFDNLQVSAIWVGTPLYLVGTTKDKSWVLVITPSGFVTWVESCGIAKVSNNFIANWQKAAKLKLGAITNTKTSIVDANGRFLFFGYIGSVFPVVDSKSSSNKKIMIPVVENNKAVIKYAMVSAEDIRIMPLSLTKHNMANLMNSLIGRPYGWGNMYFYNDCSAELKNLFVPFGIWLPRNSYGQAAYIKEHFHAVDMSSKDSIERLSYLTQNGKPLLTIIYIEGHVFLYIGYNKGNSLVAMTYQNIWGLRPDNGNTRSVIGGSVFLPLLLQYPEALTMQSLAAKKYFNILYLDQISR